MAFHHGQWVSGVNAGGCGVPPDQGIIWFVGVSKRTFQCPKWVATMYSLCATLRK